MWFLATLSVLFSRVYISGNEHTHLCGGGMSVQNSFVEFTSKLWGKLGCWFASTCRDVWFVTGTGIDNCPSYMLERNRGLVSHAQEAGTFCFSSFCSIMIADWGMLIAVSFVNPKSISVSLPTDLRCRPIIFWMYSISPLRCPRITNITTQAHSIANNLNRDMILYI